MVTPSLIKVAILKRLFDDPNEKRKLHNRATPTIGGIVLFAATLFAFSLWFPRNLIHDPIIALKAMDDYKYIVCTLLIMFFVGIKDDIIGTAPVKKLLAHIMVSMILVLMADIRIVSMHGIFGMEDLPYWASVFLSIFTYIVVVNAFNLIDGLDGLASGIGLIATLSFGTWFAFAGDFVMSCLSFALAGSLSAFLFFNFSPAKIFMGDSGSLSIGLIICILAIKLISFDVGAIQNEFLLRISKPVLAMSVLVYPLTDTLRIFIYRTVRGVSPFSADRNHLHHRLIDICGSHKKAVIILYLVNIFIITLCISLSYLNPTYVFIIIFLTTLFLAQVPFFIKKRRYTHNQSKK